MRLEVSRSLFGGAGEPSLPHVLADALSGQRPKDPVEMKRGEVGLSGHLSEGDLFS